MSDASEDEFFDAQDELGSPKSVRSLVFVDVEQKTPQNIISGELSLDHFSSTQVSLASTEDVPSIVPEKDVKNVNGVIEPPAEDEETVEDVGIVLKEHPQDEPVTNGSISTDETIPETENEHKEELPISTQLLEEIVPENESTKEEQHENNETNQISNEVESKEALENKDTNETIGTVEPPTETQHENQIEEKNTPVSNIHSDNGNKTVIVDDNLLQTSYDKSPQQKSIQEINTPENEALNLSENDIKLSERPTHLPGVKEVNLNSSPAHKTTVTHLSKPKRPPPPRPKAPPPNRPPAPKRASQTSTGKPGKPYISAIDDGLLTPNSTVDNITSEFVEALNKSTKSKPASNSSSPVKRSSSAPNRQPKSKTNSLAGSIHSNGHDEEILSSVIVRNLDTGETMPLSSAAEHCLNPLDLQIMSRTKEFSFVDESSPVSSGQNSGRSSLKAKVDLSDDGTSIASDEINIGGEGEKNEHEHKNGKKKKKLKKFLGKSMIKMKSATHSGVEKAVQKVRQARKHDSLNVSSDEESTETSQTIKIKASQSNKGPHQLSKIRQVQDIAVHVGAVWSMKFSHCGRLLATAGQDNVIWVWVLSDYYTYFSDMRSRYDTRETSMFGSNEASEMMSGIPTKTTTTGSNNDSEEEECPFKQLPFSSYVGHSADVLDLAWSKNYFILSSSMDKTVRLWHISRKECLCCFQHIDFVTAISFHPRDDRYFLSGSLDGKLRLWNIPEKKVALWNEISSDSGSSSGGALITTVNFCENGKFAVCGTYDGRCIFYDTEHLKYHTQIHVRSSRGRNNKGHKITGIESLVGEHKILVTSNDSRIRLYDLRDLSMSCKYRGLTNLSSQIKASFSHDQKYIICGSEDKCIYIWPTNVPQDMTKLSSLRRDRNDSWESLKAHDAVVTCAIFAPQPHLLIKPTSPEPKEQKSHSFLGSKKQKVTTNRVLISADFNGEIKVFFTE